MAAGSSKKNITNEHLQNVTKYENNDVAVQTPIADLADRQPPAAEIHKGGHSSQQESKYRISPANPEPSFLPNNSLTFNIINNYGPVNVDLINNSGPVNVNVVDNFNPLNLGAESNINPVLFSIEVNFSALNFKVTNNVNPHESIFQNNPNPTSNFENNPTVNCFEKNCQLESLSDEDYSTDRSNNSTRRHNSFASDN